MSIKSIKYYFISLFNIIVRSFYDPRLYWQVVHNWVGAGIKFFLISFFVINLPIMLIITDYYYDIFQTMRNIVKIEQGNFHDLESDQQTVKYAQYILDILTQLPKIEIKAGELEVNNNHKTIINSTINNKPIIEFDTRSKPDLSTNDTLIQVHKNNIQILGNEFLLNEDLRVPHNANLIVTKSDIVTLFDKLSKVLVGSIVTMVMMVYFMLYLQFIPKIILTLLILSIINIFRSLGLNYMQLIRASIIASTPAMVVGSLVLLLVIMFWSNSFVSLLLINREIIMSTLCLVYSLFVIKVVNKVLT
ncbi:DUF1189 family protein [Rickettsiales endosymbiont of Stachyamoeba lipophora]|uniref:DUF1189 family protein n=1 Tax=Rickettsiales endosymbiont of Stachyamoeba lipophora TaxID=2486578 RepID=UPI000F653F33|nr:DUF1189 family protein [Rickettsiales endosymbiont of Stachyamoeba lipophora]AZL15226.1 DUF1189 domain-containing protein [Rickettsiales endosymbiont of Stachyamoeba lipophora]